MSSDHTDREWRFYVEDMIGFCERVNSFTIGVSREDFLAEPMRYDATVRNIELIGEAAKRARIGQANCRKYTLAHDDCYPQSVNSRLCGY
jgi:uncharacterized protein with HEPN domain